MILPIHAASPSSIHRHGVESPSIATGSGREFLESTVPIDEPMCRRWFRARRGGGASVPEAADDVCESQGPRGGCMSAPE